VGRKLHSKSANNYSHSTRFDKRLLISALTRVIPNKSQQQKAKNTHEVSKEMIFKENNTHLQQYLFPLACTISKA